MPQRCQICAKLKQVGRQSRHKRGVAGKQWAKRAQKTTRIFKPNLHKATVGGVQYLLCAKCIKRIKKEELIKEEKALSLGASEAKP